jgi:hypothetical protein
MTKREFLSCRSAASMASAESILVVATVSLGCDQGAADGHKVENPERVARIESLCFMGNHLHLFSAPPDSRRPDLALD